MLPPIISIAPTLAERAIWPEGRSDAGSPRSKWFGEFRLGHRPRRGPPGTAAAEKLQLGGSGGGSPRPGAGFAFVEGLSFR